MEMDVIEIPIGRSGFADIRKNQYYYVKRVDQEDFEDGRKTGYARYPVK